MDKKDYYKEFEKLIEKYFDEHILEAKKRIDLAREKIEVSRDIIEELDRSRTTIISQKLGQYNQFMSGVKKEYARNNTKENDQIFNEHFSSIPDLEKENILHALAQYEAAYNCGVFLYNQMDNYRTPQDTSDQIEPEMDFDKMEWLGTQKQLAELFIELEKKGWIKEKDITLIKFSFTNSNTIDQVLKPTQDRHTKQSLYSGVYTPSYKPSFDAIKQKKNSEK